MCVVHFLCFYSRDSIVSPLIASACSQGVCVYSRRKTLRITVQMYAYAHPDRFHFFTPQTYPRMHLDSCIMMFGAGPSPQTQT